MPSLLPLHFLRVLWAPLSGCVVCWGQRPCPASTHGPMKVIANLQDTRTLNSYRRQPWIRLGRWAPRCGTGRHPSLQSWSQHNSSGRLAVGKEGHVFPWPVSENPALLWVQRNRCCASSFSLKAGVKLPSPPRLLRAQVLGY